jgi:NitT/TauT family transport system substrate-binding protein
MSPFVRDLKTPDLTRRQMLHAAGTGAAALLGGGVLAACGSSSSTSSGAAAAGSATKSLTKVTDQLGWLKTSEWAGFYAAINNGYYKADGIDEDLLAGGPNVIASSVVGAGHAMVGEDDNNTVLQAIAKGEPLVIYGSVYQNSPYSIISLPSAPITSLKDFAGKKIALSPATRPLLIPLLQKAGVDVGSVSFVPAVNVAQLANHEVQGYFGFSTNEAVELQQMGVKTVVTPNGDLGLKSYGNVLITTKDFMSSNKDLLTRYLRATIKGWEYAITYPNKMGPLTVDKFAAPGDSLKVESGQAIAQVPLIKNPAGIMRITYSTMQGVIDSMLASKSLSKPLNVKDVMTTDILDAVYGSQTSLPI